MKTTRVNINGGATPVNVAATIPAKFAQIVEDSDIPTKALIVQIRQSDGSYSDEVTYPPGEPVRVSRRVGIVCMPPGFVADSTPATGQAYFKVRTIDGSSIYVRLTEHEDRPKGDA